MLNTDLIKKLSKKQEPSAMINLKYKGNDVAVKTDSDGNAVLCFIGKMNEQGNIKGERYARTLKYDREGNLIKDHWELKGKAT